MVSVFYFYHNAIRNFFLFFFSPLPPWFAAFLVRSGSFERGHANGGFPCVGNLQGAFAPEGRQFFVEGGVDVNTNLFDFFHERLDDFSRAGSPFSGREVESQLPKTLHRQGLQRLKNVKIALLPAVGAFPKENCLLELLFRNLIDNELQPQVFVIPGRPVRREQPVLALKFSNSSMHEGDAIKVRTTQNTPQREHVNQSSARNILHIAYRSSVFPFPANRVWVVYNPRFNFSGSPGERSLADRAPAHAHTKKK